MYVNVEREEKGDFVEEAWGWKTIRKPSSAMFLGPNNKPKKHNDRPR
jgi:hypothetical protein